MFCVFESCGTTQTRQKYTRVPELWICQWLWTPWVTRLTSLTQQSTEYRSHTELFTVWSLRQVPVFQRGGTVVPRRAGCGSCTADLQQHPITLTVALDTKVTTW